LPQADLTTDHLIQQVMDLLNHPRRLQEMGEAAAHLAVRDSAEKLVALVQSLVRSRP